MFIVGPITAMMKRCQRGLARNSSASPSRTSLGSYGHAVTTAAKGEEAVQMFDPTLHDVVITDLGMPRMNGWEVAERIKAQSPDTPVFLLTGWGESVAAHEGSQFVDRVVAKPVSAEALMEQLAELRRTRAPAP